MKKSIGMVRNIDELGRVVIPIELRRTLNIGEKDPVEIFVDGEDIVLKKYNPGCMMCRGFSTPLIAYNDKRICSKCLEEIKKL